MKNFIKIPFGSNSSTTIDTSNIAKLSHDNAYCYLALAATGDYRFAENGGGNEGKTIYDSILTALNANPGVGIVTVELPFTIINTN